MHATTVGALRFTGAELDIGNADVAESELMAGERIAVGELAGPDADGAKSNWCGSGGFRVAGGGCVMIDIMGKT